MNNSRITLRQKEILQKLCSEDKYVTISSIADQLGVSGRTVLRELTEVEKWLDAYGYTLEKRTGIGIRLKGSLEDRKYIDDMLDEEHGIKTYSPNERQIIVISELLQNREPVKLYSFTKIFNVTEGTISNDLDKAEQWFQKYNLKLIRKPGLGIYVEGQEKAIRRAIVSLIYENINELQLLDIIKHTTTITKEKEAVLKTRGRLLNLIDIETINKLEAVLCELEERIGYKLTDNAYIGLLVHLALAIQRIRKNEKIQMDTEFLNDLKKFMEYTIADQLAKKISKDFNIEIPDDEVGYITMHIKGSKNLGTDYKSKNNGIGNYELIKLSKEIIKIVEAETGYFLEQNEKFLMGLVNHLGPAISRLRMNLDIRNPLLQEIKDHYPELLEVAGKCADMLEKKLGMKMPESEIAYIAMHIGAAIERKEDSTRKIFRAAVACTTGIGTSGLLATRIEKEYDNIEIVDVISSIHLDGRWILEKDIDLVIATVPIDDCPVPVVIVNPLLFEEDMINIERLIKNLKKHNKKPENNKEKTVGFKDKILNLQNYIQGILQVLNNFFIKEFENAVSIDELIEKISISLAASEEDREGLRQALEDRESKGSTILSGYNTILLHCKTPSIKELHFGIARIKESFYSLNSKGIKEKVEIAIIMLAPESCSKQHMEVISHISRMIVEKPEFLKKLKTDNYETLQISISSIMETFYKIKNN